MSTITQENFFTKPRPQGQIIQWYSLLLVLGLAGSIVISWLVGVGEGVRNMAEGEVTTKLVTSYSFILCCVVMIVKKYRQFSVGFLMATMSYLVTSLILSNSVSFLPTLETDAVKSYWNDFPSAMTILSFSLFGIGVLLQKRLIMKIILGISGLAVIGYLIEAGS